MGQYSVQTVVCWNLLFECCFLCAANMKRPKELSWRLVQRINIFCVKLGWSQTHTVLVIQAVFGQDVLCRTSIRKWYNAFKTGRTQLVDLQRRAHLQTSCSQANVDRIKALVQADWRVTVAFLEAQSGLPHSSIHTILRNDLKLKKKCACFIPHLLTPCHLRLHFDISTMMLHIIRECPAVFKSIVTVDKSWIYAYDPQSHAQSSEWLAPGEPRPQKALWSCAPGKVLLVSFFDWKGMVHYEMLRNRTVNTTTFLAILTRLQATLTARRPRRCHQLHMDNALPYNARDTKMKLLLLGIRRVPHPPYSPDLSPNDFWFYPRLKRNLKGRYFRNLDELKNAVHTQLGLIPAAEYHKAILESWPMRWARCVFRDGGYFEGLRD